MTEWPIVSCESNVCKMFDVSYAMFDPLIICSQLPQSASICYNLLLWGTTFTPLVSHNRSSQIGGSSQPVLVSVFGKDQNSGEDNSKQLPLFLVIPKTSSFPFPNAQNWAKSGSVKAD